MLADTVTSPPPLMAEDSCVFRMIVFLLAKISRPQASLRVLSAAHGVVEKPWFPRIVVSGARKLAEHVIWWIKCITIRWKARLPLIR